MTKTAIYAGSFDPVQNGHIDVLFRASALFDRIYVVVAPNADKKPLLAPEERVEIFRQEIDGMSKSVSMSGLPFPDISVGVMASDDLTVLLADRAKAEYLIRGVRNQMDWAYEQTIQHANARLAKRFGVPNPETVYLGAPLNDQLYVSSTLVRGLMKAKDWKVAVSPFVPVSTLRALEKIHE